MRGGVSCVGNTCGKACHQVGQTEGRLLSAELSRVLYPVTPCLPAQSHHLLLLLPRAAPRCALWCWCDLTSSFSSFMFLPTSPPPPPTSPLRCGPRSVVLVRGQRLHRLPGELRRRCTHALIWPWQVRGCCGAQEGFGAA